jgi:hypothetical protein
LGGLSSDAKPEKFNFFATFPGGFLSTAMKMQIMEHLSGIGISGFPKKMTESTMANL